MGLFGFFWCPHRPTAVAVSARTPQGILRLSGQIILAVDDEMNAGRSLVAGLKIGRVVRIIHEVAGGLRVRPFKDHAQGCGLVFPLDLFVVGCARNILAAMFGDCRPARYSRGSSCRLWVSRPELNRLSWVGPSSLVSFALVVNAGLGSGRSAAQMQCCAQNVALCYLTE